MTHNVLAIAEFQFDGHKLHRTGILDHHVEHALWYVVGMWYVGGHEFKLDEANTSKSPEWSEDNIYEHFGNHVEETKKSLLARSWALPPILWRFPSW